MLETMKERLRHAIVARGLRQGEAAAAIGISAQYLSDITAGRKQASRRLMYDMARALKVSPEWLIDGEGAMEIDGSDGVLEAALLSSEIINAPSTSKRRALAVALTKLSDKEVDALDRFIELYTEQIKKDGA